jgi:hypothetical protein
MKIETTFFRDHGTEYIALPFSFVSLNSWKHQILLRSEGERFLPNSPTVPWSSQTHLCCLFLIEPSPKPTFPSSKIRPSWRPYPDHPRPTKTHPKVALSTLLLPPPPFPPRRWASSPDPAGQILSRHEQGTRDLNCLIAKLLRCFFAKSRDLSKRTRVNL